MIKLKDLLNESLMTDVIEKYIEASKYDILNGWGSCAFYTQDFLDTKIATGVIYMPFANPVGSDYEDHIVPIVHNYIIDFAKVPGKGVSKQDRSGHPPQLNPGNEESSWPYITEIKPDLFKESGVYGKLGYLSNANYADWEYDAFPRLKDNVYPVRLSSLPDFSHTSIERPPLKK